MQVAQIGETQGTASRIVKRVVECIPKEAPTGDSQTNEARSRP